MQVVWGRWDDQLEDGGDLGGGDDGLGLGSNEERGFALAGAAGSSAATSFSFCSATPATAERAVRDRALLGNVRAD